MALLINNEHWLTQHLEQQPDLVHTNPWTVVKPVRHFVRKIMAYDVPEKNGLYGVWSVESLWAPLFPIELEGVIGFSVRRLEGATFISLEAMPPPLAHDVFRQRIEDAVLPYLRSIDSMERLYQEIAQRQANLVEAVPQSIFASSWRWEISTQHASCWHGSANIGSTSKTIISRSRR
jgi:hypothetical protein